MAAEKPKEEHWAAQVVNSLPPPPRPPRPPSLPQPPIQPGLQQQAYTQPPNYLHTQYQHHQQQQAAYYQQYYAAQQQQQLYYAQQQQQAQMRQQQQQLQLQQQIYVQQQQQRLQQQSYSASVSAVSQQTPAVDNNSTTTTPVSYAAVTQGGIAKKPNPMRFSAGAATTASTNVNDKSSWPPALKQYVVRAFNTCTSNDDRAFMQGELKKKMNEIKERTGNLNMHKWEIEPIPKLPHQLNDHKRMKLEHDATQSQQGYRSRFESVPGYRAPENANNHSVPSSSSVQSTPSSSSSYSFQNAGGVYGPSSVGGRGGKYGPGSGNDYSPTPSPTNKDEKKGKKKSKKGLNDSILSVEDTRINKKRADRFKNDTQCAYHRPPSPPVHVKAEPGTLLTEEDLAKMKITGTCENLEKEYLRLTSAPHPSVVRPERVLKLALNSLIQKWEEDSLGVGYVYMCSQLKAIRQDLTVQHIKNDFTVQVYEVHARTALESGDMNEYNQCQTQLKHLYAADLKGSEEEFLAYRILYYIYLQGNKKYQGGSGDLLDIMKQITSMQYQHEAVKHALDVRKCIQQENYYRFFQLLHTTPNLGNFILEPMINNWRFVFLQRLIRACRASVKLSVDFIVKSMGFMSLPEGLIFLKKANCVLIPSEKEDAGETSEQESGLDIDCKASNELDQTLGSDPQSALLL